MPALYWLVQFLVRISISMIGKQDGTVNVNDARMGGVSSDTFLINASEQ